MIHLAHKHIHYACCWFSCKHLMKTKLIPSDTATQRHNRSTSIVTFISLTAVLKISAYIYIATWYVASMHIICVHKNELAQVLNESVFAGIRKWHHWGRWQGKLMEPWLHQQKNWKAVSQFRVGILQKMLLHLPSQWPNKVVEPLASPLFHSSILVCTKCTSCTFIVSFELWIWTDSPLRRFLM